MKRKTMNDKPEQPQPPPPEQPAGSESGALIEPSEEAGGRLVGVPGDHHVHEAVTTRPADHAAKDHTVGAVLQPGYRMGDALIRPARVIVLQWQGDQGRGSGDGE